MGLGGRLIGIFISPTETFADIVRRPSLAWVAPLVVLTILAAVSSGLVIHRVGMEQMEQIVRSQLAQSRMTQNLTPEQMERAVERGVTVAKYKAYIGPLLFPFIGLLIVAGVFALMTNFVLGSEVKYTTLMSVTAYGMMPGLVLGIVNIITIHLKKPADIDIQNIVVSNLGPLVSAESSKVLHRLASFIDLFSFWQIALMALGISIAARFSFGKGLVAVVVPWLVWVLAVAGLSALF
jgi:hypothetical protein